MSDKKHIIDAIVSIARKLGRPPSRAEFFARSGISMHFVLRRFRGWNHAVRAAGLQPNTLNVRVEDRALLEDWGKQVRKNRGPHTRYAQLRQGKYDPSTIERRFGRWSEIAEAFRKFAKGKREWADVLALLPAPEPNNTRERKPYSASSASSNTKQHRPRGDRPAYGNPMDFHGLRHEPVNEQGVVLLFGMVARQLGFLIEAVQTGFPDCEAKRQIGPERWQRVNIEFEFESRNFRDHRHPLQGCDIIVCWRHNWDDCPKHMEVLELSSVIKSLALRSI